MMEHVREGHISGLIFSKLARLARNTKELLEFSDFFRAENADLISLQEAIDTSSPAGRLFYTMIAAMAQWEREEIAERVAVSVPIRAELGKSLGGRATFGYQWRDNRLVPEPNEAPVRKLIYELFAEHKRKKTVARLLNDKGYRTRKGAKFSDRTVERLLRDPTAKGLRRANYTTHTDQKQRVVLKPKSDWIYTQVEPVVSAELWDTCNAILDEQRKRRKPPSRKTVHVFAGLTFCSCGTKMYVPSNTPKYVCKSCRNKVPIVDLDAIFHEQLKHLFFSPSEITEFLHEGEEVMRQKEELLSHLEAEQGKIRREMDKLYDLYMSDEITKTGFGEKYHPLSERLEQVENQQPELQAELDVLKIHYLSSDEILSEARNLYGRWGNLAPEEKRTIVEAITESIVVGDDEISIHLHYLPSAGERSLPPDDEDDGSSQPHSKNEQEHQPYSTDKKQVSHHYNDLDDGNMATKPEEIGRAHV
jgi:site-specific DNA recombinase